MLRIAGSLRSSARPLLARGTAAAAQYHRQATLPYPADKGLAPFLSPASVDFLYNMRQVELLNNVNRLAGGTENEGKSLAGVIFDAAEDPSQTALQNNASQAWNMNFFLQTLTNEPRPPHESVRRTIAEQFGSFDRFKEMFSQHALALFGNGWTWMVQNESGKLSVMNTYNAGSPLTAIRTNIHAKVQGVSFSTISRRIGNHQFVKLTPVLGLSMWQEAYLPDYGIDRATYVERFWESVNWLAVDERLMSVQRTPSAMR
ncbi:hypothetical protein IWQ56_001107 [Coemansia nantahalensis]|uniref:Uncharacterized protein n=2 Tax=Coemansia TaxID=4863 RepID=A0ACC1L0T3_9FUNG|nr:hypothetical protein IWQ57_002034 [Coemansia nantahalensis]KAJ2773129.1 hypothetical protein IWQ56_001107 [Coemansia nantahalensis]KAJ2798689.1 hypothetical protein H4R21_003830 [Coemansia helicoidea]